ASGGRCPRRGSHRWTCSSAHRVNNGCPTSCSGRRPTPSSTSPRSSGPTSGARSWRRRWQRLPSGSAVMVSPPSKHRRRLLPVPVLLALFGPKRGVRLEVEKQATLGRSSDADLQLVDGKVSRLHCRFDLRDGALFVEDLGSQNGTYVNGDRLAG